MSRVSSYLAPLMDPKCLGVALKRITALARKVQQDLQASGAPPITHLAYAGNSGALVASHLALRLGLPLILVRKERESSHGVRVEGLPTDDKPCRYLIVDDLICAGLTVTRIIRTIAEELISHHGLCSGGAEPVGVLLYEDSRTSYPVRFFMDRGSGRKSYELKCWSIHVECDADGEV